MTEPKYMRDVAQYDWSTVESEEVLPGIHRQTVHGAKQSIVRYLYAPGSIFPVHRHHEEQITLVIRGAIAFEVEDTRYTLESGGLLVIPSGTPHGARVIGSETVESFNFLSPRRSENPSLSQSGES